MKITVRSTDLNFLRHQYTALGDPETLESDGPSPSSFNDSGYRALFEISK